MSSDLIEFLMRELLISRREIDRLIHSAPERYKVYYIIKRSGGFREIAHPATELKVAQRAIAREYLNKLPIHQCATAYKPGSSIKQNAEMHIHNRPILKYDFKDFFPSITEQAWLSYCMKHELFERADAIRSGRLLFRRPRGGRILRLSVGAPSSPVLSNILLNDFDEEINSRVLDHKITYTRYADDMTFSALRTGNLMVVDKILRSAINRIKSPRLIINSDKTIMVTPKYRRQVTGLILTLDGKVSIGRDRKREIRAAIHHYALGKLDSAMAAKLAGNLGFAKDVDPEFFKRMEMVYGRDILNQLKQSVKGYKRKEPNGSET
jgi:RNA-directed DNA polymerase